jgi:3-methyladenine DNA glycosylase/8-oxoguanine DNA glycosylase
VVRSHGWYDLPPFLYDAAAGELRVIADLGRGPAEVRFRGGPGGVEVESNSTVRPDRLRDLAVRVFSLDVDLGAFAKSAAADPDLSWAVAGGHGRFLRGVSLWEDAVKMLLTTNCSWAATRGMVRRAVDAFGEGGAFPTPESIARRREATVDRVVRSGYRTPALVAFARNVASARLDLSEWESPRRESGAIREDIIAQRGFGPYAAEGLLRLIGRHDFFAIDSWTRMKYRELHPFRGSLESSIARRYRRYGKFQGLAFWLDLTRSWHEPTAKNEFSG